MVTRSKLRQSNGISKAAIAGTMFVMLAASGHTASAQSLDLKLSSPSLTFADSNPLSKADVPALENPISVHVTSSGPGIVHILVLANGNMQSLDGGPSIPASNVYWTGTGTGYESGKMSCAQEVEAACGPLSHSPGAGLNFFLKRGLYDSGTYELSVTVMAIVQ